MATGLAPRSSAPLAGPCSSCRLPAAPLRAVEALAKLYPNARWETRPLTPHEVGAKAIGHFGFFRERFRDSLWREAADWLERQ
jgi:predicted alpha/beta hydrolase